MDALLEVVGLTVSFRDDIGRFNVVEDVDLRVGRGETVGLVGESGCGKSVTAMSLMRLNPEPPSRVERGTVRFEGIDVLGLDAHRLRKLRGDRIGMIFQEPMTSLNPTFTVGFQIVEVLRLHRGLSGKAAEAAAVETLRLVGVGGAERRLGQYPHELSGGLRQRVMIAVALACRPALLVADEPTTALDVTIQAQILELLKDLSRKLGVAMLIITHNLGVVARYADRVNVMYAGRIIERGTAREIYANPRHPYTLGLLRSVPRLDEPRKSRLDPISGQPPDLTRLPPGCAFAPRCAFVVERCRAERPELVTVAESHTSACWETDRLAVKVPA
jgi:oligopeptide/dipeptide ABC transporter ATP-binding protein